MNSTTTLATSAVTSSFEESIRIFALDLQRNLNFFVNPVICILGTFLNIICCIVFLSSKFRTKMYFLLFWVSLFHAGALFIMIFLPIITTTDWYYARSLATVVYRLVFRPWMHNTLSMCALLCNLAVSWDRYILVSQKCKCCCSRIPHWLLVGIFFLVSAPCFIFVFFAYRIGEAVNPNDPKNKYYNLFYTDFGRSSGFNIVRIIMFGIRDMVIWVVFIVINIMLIIEMRKHMNKKKLLTNRKANQVVLSIKENTVSNTIEAINSGLNEAKDQKKKSSSDKAEARITQMVIFTSLTLIIGRVPNMTQVLFFIFNPIEGINILVFNICAILLFLSYTVQIFIFYFYDKNFKKFIKKNIFFRIGKLFGRK